MKYTFLFILTLLLLNFSNKVDGQEINAFLSGKVVNEKNLPIPNANIKITLIPLNKICNTITNKKGIFNIPNLSPGGPYIIEVYLNGYSKTTKEILQLELGRTDVSLYIQSEFKELAEVKNQNN
jgi:hypothetical protein